MPWNRRSRRYRWAIYWRRQGHVKKDLVEDCPVILEIGALNAAGFAGSVKTGGLAPVFVTLHRIAEELRITFPNAAYSVTLLATSPHFGGIRWWFQCPACHRRAGKLYLAGAPATLACRTCAGLTYRTCQQHRCTTLSDWQILHLLAKARPGKYTIPR